ncbi:MAG: 6,7-dimethyl-8-ribityllumazine synthase [bacterium]
MRKIKIIASEFNVEITKQLTSEANVYLDNNGYENTQTIWVPGAFEIPLMCQRELDDVDAIIALGTVIKGETEHFEYVCQGVTNGIMQVMLEKNKPIGFGILMTNNIREARQRAKKGESNKGYTTAKTIDRLLHNNKNG